MKSKEISKGTAKIMHAVGKIKIVGMKHKADILFGVGLTTGIAATVLACMGTRKIDELTEAKNSALNKIQDAVEHPEHYVDEYPEGQDKIDRAITYNKYILGLLKAFAPAIAVETLSATLLIMSHKEMKKTAAALAASGAIATAQIARYKSWVSENFGDEKNDEIVSGIKTVEIEKTVIDSDGKETVNIVSEKIMTDPVPGCVYEFTPESSLMFREMVSYDVYYDRYNEDDIDEDLLISKTEINESILNAKLKAQGYLQKSEFLELFGFQQEVNGIVDGWLCNEYATPGINDTVEIKIEKVKIPCVSDTGSTYFDYIWTITVNCSTDILSYLNVKSNNGKI